MSTQADNVARIFDEAVELQDPAERAAYLHTACGQDSGLRAEVEQLLMHDDAAGSFLDRANSCELAATLDDPITERPGTVIGPYKLLEQIGEGGFGVVFMAEQQAPIRRKVALKVLKPGMDTRQVIARFEVERQALALMDHPNIAKVLDAGQTTSGRPYFVMDLVKGLPITEHCDQAQLTPIERLKLFVDVCQAVQHAHQKGIIHRDIKPTNVLVTLQDGTRLVKVIDFGIAKALGQQLTDKTLYTGFAQLIGSPLYMSPEQAAFSNVDVDTRSDIYSLGVLLYELMTGTTPLNKERFKEASYDEIRRIIREEEPPKPSTRISTLGQAALTVSSQRKSDPRQLSRLFRGELDWILMKCLEKDRNRRYETANGLARDIQRYLRDEPVQACPPSAWYRFGKFARRNRAALTVSAALLLVVLGGLAVSNWLISGQRDVALRSERERTLELFNAKLAQARANRLSRRQGQRFGTLKVLEEAAQIARELDLPPERFAELRNEAIACMALADLRPSWALEDVAERLSLVDFDSALRRYALPKRDGTVSIRDAGTDAEIASLSNTGAHSWVKLSPDGQYASVLSDSDGAKIWSLAGPKPTILITDADQSSYREYPAARGNFSPDSRLFAVGHDDGSVIVYDPSTGHEVWRLSSGGPPKVVAFRPQTSQLAVCGGTTLQIYDIKTQKEILVPPLSVPEGVDFLTWRLDGKTLAVVGQDLRIHLYDIETRRPGLVLEGPKEFGILVEFNHAGDLLAGVSWDGMLRLWDLRTGDQVFKTPSGWIGIPRFSSDDHQLASAFRDGRIELLEIAASRIYRTLDSSLPSGKPRRGVYETLAVQGGGRLLVVSQRNGFGLWDLASGNHLETVLLPSRHQVVFEPGSLLSSGTNGVLRWPIVADPASISLLGVGPPQRISEWSFRGGISRSADGRVMAGATWDGGLALRGDHPNLTVPLVPHEDVSRTAVSPDSRWVATSSFSLSTRVKIWEPDWESQTAKCVQELPTGRDATVSFSPDGKWFATSGDAICVWTSGSWKAGPRFATLSAADLAFSPDSKLLAFETGYGAVRLVDPATGREYARLEDPNQDRARCIAFGPDGAQLVINGEREALHVWDLRLIREELAKMDLDWDLPAYPPKPVGKAVIPLQVKVDLGDLDPNKP
jgi:serine/threonine protein kinase/WD40 repeat protein